MNKIKTLSLFFLAFTTSIFISCNGQSENKDGSATAENRLDNIDKKPTKKNLTNGKGSLSFKLNGQYYETDPARTKCWSAANIPLAMLMAYGDDLTISWQMGFTEGETFYKLDGDSKGTINFTIGDKTYWTRSVTGDNFLDIKITNVKDNYNVKMLSGTFEGVLEDKDGNKVQITEGKFVTEDI